MAFIDGTVVNVALPAIQNSFHASVVGVQRVLESYGVLLSALTLVAIESMINRPRSKKALLEEHSQIRQAILSQHEQGIATYSAADGTSDTLDI